MGVFMQQTIPKEQELLKKINYFINSNQTQEAWKQCLKLTKKKPKFGDGWLMQSMVATRMSNYKEALSAINKAIALQPKQLNLLLHKVMILEQGGYRKQSITLAQSLDVATFSDIRAIMTLAAFYQRHQLYPQVKQCYEKALKIDPGNQSLLFNLATINLFLGRIDDAESLSTKALQGSDLDFDIHFFRSNLKKQSSDNNHIKELETLNSKSSNDPVKKAKGLYALAKELEDCEEYDKSFTVRSKAAKTYRKSLRYNFREDINFLKTIRATYTRDTITDLLNTQKQVNSSAEPIFIAGLPRSGTTLLERIVGSHSDVYSCGELPHFSRLMSSGIEQLQLSPSLSRSQLVTESVKLNFSKLGQRYLEMSRPVEQQAKHFIDKFPQNSLHIGPIHLALPNAKFLLLERHPLDVCYSVYKQLFTEAFQFSYDFDELAEYYFEHQKLVKHWQSILSESVKTVKYEDLVSDLESTAVDVIRFCQLDWQEDCLNFHKNTQASTTASASQVRQKVYSSSIGMWKNYHKQLEPLIQKLESLGCLEGWEY